MKDKKPLWKKILFLPVPMLILLTVVSGVALGLAFLKFGETSPLSYISYALSAYTLTVVCIFFAKVFPTWSQEVKQKIYDHPFGNQYMTDAAFKVRVTLYVSFGINFFYSVFKLISGIVMSSFWWGAIAIYYMLLAFIRFLLLRYMRADEKSPQGLLAEYRRYRLCGILLMLLNISLSGVVFQMVWQNKAYSYPGTLIFVAAAYTFYTVTVSIVEIVQYRKYNSPVLSASKAIRLAAALVSLLSLETAMLAQFGTEEEAGFNQLMTALTGAGVCILVLAISVYMIVHATKEIKKIKTDNISLIQ